MPPAKHDDESGLGILFLEKHRLAARRFERRERSRGVRAVLVFAPRKNSEVGKGLGLSLDGIGMGEGKRQDRFLDRRLRADRETGEKEQRQADPREHNFLEPGILAQLRLLVDNSCIQPPCAVS